MSELKDRLTHALTRLREHLQDEGRVDFLLEGYTHGVEIMAAVWRHPEVRELLKPSPPVALWLHFVAWPLLAGASSRDNEPATADLLSAIERHVDMPSAVEAGASIEECAAWLASLEERLPEKSDTVLRSLSYAAFTRVPTAVVDALQASTPERRAKLTRHYGEDATFSAPFADMRAWQLETATGVQLTIPLEADEVDEENSNTRRLRPARREARKVLGEALRFYLADWQVTWEQDPNMSRNGLHEVDPRHMLTNVLGFPLVKADNRLSPRTGEPYMRPHPNHERQLRDAYERLLQTRLHRVGDTVLTPPQALLFRYDQADSKRHLFQHPPVICELVRRNFVQVPKRAVRLDETSMVVGLAVSLRETAPSWHRSRRLQRTARDWAVLLGEPLEDRLRRDGPTAYWPGFVKRLRTVVEEGGFGCLHLGDGDDAASQQIGVEPRDELARVYAGLASHAQTGTAPELRPRRPGRPRRELGPSRR